MEFCLDEIVRLIAQRKANREKDEKMGTEKGETTLSVT
jgi:hypothetical protein